MRGVQTGGFTESLRVVVSRVSIGSRISSIARTKYKHMSYQLLVLQKGGVTLIPCYPSTGAETDIQRGDRKGAERPGDRRGGGGL
eukprot:613328-Prymnesium_polylepis.1